MRFPLDEKRILVTGGFGFLGKSVIRELHKVGCRNLILPRSREFDLRDPRAVEALFRENRPQLVIHLAGVVGGIGANEAEPGRFYYDNAAMGLQALEYSRRFAVEKFVSVGTVCSYPYRTPLPFREEDFWAGYPEEINAPYALAKKMLLVQSQAYRAQYGVNAITLILANLYGPGERVDHERSHVIPALVQKCLRAKEKAQRRVEFWGDGTPTRDFLYIEDAARGIVSACENYSRAEPINLGTGQETSIAELADRIARECGYRGQFAWDTSRPNGQLRRCLDISRARKLLGFEPRVDLSEGLARTVAGYRMKPASWNGRVKGNIPAMGDAVSVRSCALP